ncbi:MAG: Eco57I restriction-modification methylase domain-containing protein [Rhodocyclaceae bacterium]|nr:Eco57I restriction-modification methylase domain-containing protein [Rhodocyclaceae bacterium]
MATMFDPVDGGVCRLLDPGAGIGSLTAAFLDLCAEGRLRFRAIATTAFEIDAMLLDKLRATIAAYADRLPLASLLRNEDFIEATVNHLQFGNDEGFTHAILNPPYKKIQGASRHRLLLRQVGIETVNLYSAFVALTLATMAPGGQVVAIVPRSFCNGPYYRPFRDYLLSRAAIRHIHLFTSRDKAFRDDEVLQENVIIRLDRARPQGAATLSTSTDDSFADLASHQHPFDRIVFPGDPERFIHVPTSPARDAIECLPAIHHSLDELGIHVSTGPVVDFRLKPHLRDMPGPDTVPLLYPGHFEGQRVVWPRMDAKKPNALARTAETEKWLYPNGFYCVVRRFSSKEEKRRVVASVTRPDALGNAPRLGFENHLNVFHENKLGLDASLAHGLAAYLNTTAIDENFRRFNGHTQVNATDLRLIKYPARDILMALGKWAGSRKDAPSQADLDAKLEELCA